VPGSTGGIAVGEASGRVAPADTTGAWLTIEFPGAGIKGGGVVSAGPGTNPTRSEVPKVRRTNEVRAGPSKNRPTSRATHVPVRCLQVDGNPRRRVATVLQAVLPRAAILSIESRVSAMALLLISRTNNRQ
jgi:hypothetical protein